MNWSKVDKPYVVMVVIIFLFLTYLSVDWKLNKHRITITDDYNNTVETVRQYYYENDYVPVKNVGENKMGHMLSMWHVIIIVGGMIFYKMLSREKDGELKTADSTKQKYFDIYTRRHDVDDFSILEETFLQNRRYDSSESKPLKRWIFIEAHFNERAKDGEGWRIQGIAVDPFTNYEMDRCDLENFPKGFRPKCEICGNMPDERIITPEGYRIWKEQFKTGNQ